MSYTYEYLGDSTVRNLTDHTALTKSSVTCSGASAVLVAASSTRYSVIITSAPTNAVLAIDPTGGTCALDAGIILNPGDTIRFDGVPAKSAMTQFGTNGNKLTVYVGTI